MKQQKTDKVLKADDSIELKGVPLTLPDSSTAQSSGSSSDESEDNFDPKQIIKSNSKISHTKILLFVPNLIDYTRYFLVLTGMYFAFNEKYWLHFTIYYYVAIAMDIVDGSCARRLDQVTRYGSCLDMVCDRASVSMMYLILA